MRMSQALLTLAFLRPFEQDFFVNRLTAFVSSHPFHHVELYFDSLDMCFSIIMGETAGFKRRNLSNPNYTLVSLAVSSDEYRKCLEFCKTAEETHIQFDNMSMFWSYCRTHCCERNSMATRKTFCSKIITEALRSAGVHEVRNLQPSSATPSRLFSALRNSPRIVCNTVPFKRNVLIATPLLLRMDDERSNRRPELVPS